jgi:hypothetical protein
VPSALQLAKGRGTKAQKSTGTQKLAAFGLASESNPVKDLLHICGCLSEQGKQQGQKEIAKANAKDGTEKA